jgi:hypothetical protein
MPLTADNLVEHRAEHSGVCIGEQMEDKQRVRNAKQQKGECPDGERLPPRSTVRRRGDISHRR